jgi:ABC-type transport system involved in cytochrome c biogenesis permease subunit
MSSTLFYNACGVGYFLGLFLYIANLAWKRAVLRRAATTVVALSFIAQTIGMIFRWHEAGLVEIEAAERATGLVLTGTTRLVVYTQHPPWSNLYEILVYMAWGIIFVFLISEVKFRIRFAGIISLLLALISLGLASLTADATIKPLVPALQSWWIMIHVISSAIGYAAGTMGATMSLLYLLKAKDRVSMQSVGAGIMAVSVLLFLVLGRGEKLFTTMEYRVKVLASMGGTLISAGRQMDNGNFQPYYAPTPNVGYLLLGSVVLSLVACIVMWMSRKKDDVPRGLPLGLYLSAFGLTTATIALILINATINTTVNVPAEISRTLVPPGPWRFAIQSAQWDLALFAIVWGAQLIGAIGILFPNGLRNLLPDAKRLDRAAYYSVLVSFALVAVVLVTGALWAHYAWGRYWGWDPKETGALVIWITYAIYLHARVTYGWVGVRSAVIAALSFFVILAGFLGVNLGWFADGLHSYGSS